MRKLLKGQDYTVIVYAFRQFGIFAEKIGENVEGQNNKRCTEGF